MATSAWLGLGLAPLRAALRPQVSAAVRACGACRVCSTSTPADAESGAGATATPKRLSTIEAAFADPEQEARQRDAKLFPEFPEASAWEPASPREYRSQLTDAEFDAVEASEAVRRAFDLHNASQMERNQHEVDKAIKRFRMHKDDTGSAPVQAAILTVRINYMVKHMETHKKDVHSRRGLQGMLNKRRKLLKYLRKRDFGVYRQTVLALNLRDNYY
eukprot:g2808.t1